MLRFAKENREERLFSYKKMWIAGYSIFIKPAPLELMVSHRLTITFCNLYIRFCFERVIN